jgi:hypothetical protein
VAFWRVVGIFFILRLTTLRESASQLPRYDLGVHDGMDSSTQSITIAITIAFIRIWISISFTLLPRKGSPHMMLLVFCFTKNDVLMNVV